MATMGKQRAQQTLEIAKAAGEQILQVYENAFSVEFKDDRSPLTAADLAAHRVIAQGLGNLDPDVPILSEEGADIPFETRIIARVPHRS